MKKALVTGGGGFVGSHIVKQLLSNGVECVVIGRGEYPELAAQGVKCLRGDIADESVLVTAAAGADIVFHTAALAGIWGRWAEYYRTNVLGTANVLEACRKNNVPRMVYTSTPSVVFNGTDIVNGDESLPYGRKVRCNYAKSKIIAEKMVLGANCGHLLTCAIRPHLVWGPGDPHLIPRLLERGRNGELKIVGKGLNLVDISYVDNVAAAHLAAAENLEGPGTAAGQAYFISQGTPVNLWDWVAELFRTFGVAPVQKRVPFGMAYAAGAILEGVHTVMARDTEPKMTRFLAEQLAKSHYFSIEKAKSDLGYVPVVSSSEGMKRLLEEGVM